MSEQATADAVQPSPANGQTTPSESEFSQREPNYGGTESRRRLYRLLEEIWGPSRQKQIRGLVGVKNSRAETEAACTTVENAGTQKRILLLCAMVWGAPEHIVESLQKIYHGTAPGHTVARTTASDAEVKAAYQRGKADLLAEQAAKGKRNEALAIVCDRHSDFQEVCKALPELPRVVWAEVTTAAEAGRTDLLEAVYLLREVPLACEEIREMGETDLAVRRFRNFAVDRGAR